MQTFSNGQTMSVEAANKRIDREAKRYEVMLREQYWSLEHAHDVLRNHNLSLFQIAGLARAIACFQCSDY